MFGSYKPPSRKAPLRRAKRMGKGGAKGGAYQAGYQAALKAMKGRNTAAPGGSKGQAYGYGKNHDEYPDDATNRRGPVRVGWRW